VNDCCFTPNEQFSAILWQDQVAFNEPANAATSIKQSPVLKGHLFLVQSLNISNELNLFKRSPVLKGHFFLSKG
jgi:hypothetical protein